MPTNKSTYIPSPVESSVVGLLENKEVDDIRDIVVLNGKTVSSKLAVSFHDRQPQATQVGRPYLVPYTNDFHQLWLLKQSPKIVHLGLALMRIAYC